MSVEEMNANQRKLILELRNDLASKNKLIAELETELVAAHSEYTTLMAKEHHQWLASQGPSND